jgi:hypothetical protein
MKKFSFLVSTTNTQSFIGKITLTLMLVLSSFGYISAQENNTSPLNVSEFGFSPSTIDTTSNSQIVTVTVRITDNVSDVKHAVVRFRSATGNQFTFVSMDSQNRISGDGRDGVYRGEAIFPQNSKAGTWYVFEINAFDNLSYKNFYSSEIAQRSFPTELQVISLNEDMTAPEIIDFSFTPSAIDTTNDSQNVTVTVRVADAQTSVRSVSVGFKIPNDDMVYSVNMNRISGDDRDGIYQGAATFSRSAASGIYDASVYTSDALGNSRYLGKAELISRGFAAELQIINTVSPSQPTQKSNKRIRVLQL